MELESGTGLSMKIGFPDLSAMKDNAEYQRVHVKFRVYHTLSEICMVVGLVAKFIYLCKLTHFIDMTQ